MVDAVKRADLEVRVKGKFVQFERFDGKNGPIFENLIVIPSVDEFSSPIRVVVKSNHQVAQIDTMVDVCAVIQSRYWRNNSSGKVNYTPELWLVN